MKVLIRADTTNGHFDALDSEWDEQFRRFDEPSERYQSALLDHARQIAQEEPPSPVYGIFVLYDESAPEGERYAGLVHVNHAFPLTSKHHPSYGLGSASPYI